MKGIVFTEFMEMVEDTFSERMADDIIENSPLPSGGAYTAVGVYDHGEMVCLVGALSARTGIPVEDLQETFGRHLFGRFRALYPAPFDGIDDALTFLASVEDTIHSEVRKLYPEAELPTIDTAFAGPDRLIVTYRSTRPFGPLCRGLISACCDHFGGSYAIASEDRSRGGTSEVHFTITRI